MIDATIVIQIVNFLIVWLALYGIVLKPIFTIIATQDAYSQAIKQEEELLHANLVALQDRNYALWHMVHLHYKQTQKYTSTPILPRIEYARNISLVAESDIDFLIASIQRIIVKKVKESI